MTALALLLAAASASNLSPGAGISEALARDRAAKIRSLHYDLVFTIPERRADPVYGRASIKFELRSPSRIVLDFEQPRNHVLNLAANGRAIEVTLIDGHLVVPESALNAGQNTIDIEFRAGDEALNRNDDFLYTLFVPARAHLVFPCFDQPSLKARFKLALRMPGDWQAVSNGAEEGRSPGGDFNSKTNPMPVIRFAETQPLPAYLIAFAAGKFSIETAERSGRTFRMLHRETDSAKVARNREAIFDLHARSLAWLEAYTGIPYPWGKFDFVAIPSFQFGGMEHAGAIFYNASSLLLDESAAQNQLLGRASVIAHETSHMWFGDLVTMRWFNDVWMKEVLANFFAAKIVNPSFPEVNHELRFLLAHYPAAYGVDRTAGTNPIRQDLANLNEAGVLYGPIAYEKAPIAMRQLEMMLGETGFRDGLREYLKTYSFGNAAWPDLIQMLRARSKEDIPAWSNAWIERRGRPEITTTVRADREGKIAQLTLTQRDPLGRNVIWPQHLQVTIGYPGRTKTLSVSARSRITEVTEAHGMDQPQYVIPNGEGLGYGLFLLDAATLRYLLEDFGAIQDPLTRGSALVEVWENLLEARVKPSQFLDFAMREVPRESDEQNTQRLLAGLVEAFWQFLPHDQRLARAPALERLLREGMRRAGTASQKSAWFNAFRKVALTPDALAWLERVWAREEKIEGLSLAETDEINIALDLAVREIPGWRHVLAFQRDRTLNPDRKARFEFVMPAVSADSAERVQAFQRLRNAGNRSHEPWVLESLAYLNHPLRQEHALRFILPSLELLPEIQRTGDIFFPMRWADAALGGHQSPQAAALVRDFLANQPQLSQRLQWIVLTSADDLFRTAKVQDGARQ